MFKEFIIETGVDTILKILQKRKEKGKVKLANFLFSEKMQRTLGTIYKEYYEALDEWEASNEAA